MLVVDDDFMVARLHSSVVAAEPGFEVAGIAAPGKDALAAVEAARPDLVLLDVYLPDMTGMEVLGALRECRGEDVDVIVISAARDLDTLRTALRGGVFQYLVKPFEIESLQHGSREYAAHRAELAELDRGGAGRRRPGVPRRAGARRGGGSPRASARRRPTLVLPGARGGRRGRAVRHRVRRVDRAVPQQHPALPRAPRVGGHGRDAPEVRRGRAAGAPLPAALTAMLATGPLHVIGAHGPDPGTEDPLRAGTASSQRPVLGSGASPAAGRG